MARICRHESVLKGGVDNMLPDITQGKVLVLEEVSPQMIVIWLCGKNITYNHLRKSKSDRLVTSGTFVVTKGKLTITLPKLVNSMESPYEDRDRQDELLDLQECIMGSNKEILFE